MGRGVCAQPPHPLEWPDAEALKTKKLKKEDYVRPYGQRMARQKRFGAYFIFKSLEQGRSLASASRSSRRTTPPTGS